ncbi:MAG TPA: GNAT family N-acetyltransferase [Flavipsychrobacter sp.]|nr:GNAT family N-acetyltransferase [Flavipsychrobacter sp.]
MVTLLRTDSTNEDYRKLVSELDKDLAARDGDDAPFFAQYNKSDDIKYVIVAYENGIAVGSGAIKHYEGDTVEIKRMYVPLEHRGKGIASIVLKDLELWAKELNYAKCILETGKKMPEAIRVYEKNGYALIPNYGQYAGVEESVCFEKLL